MNPNYLDFEQPIAELEARIEELRLVRTGDGLSLNDEITRLEEKCQKLVSHIFKDLTPWQVAQIARHPRRPYTLDYIKLIFGEFDELHGDRSHADDQAIIGGITELDGMPVMVIGHQKGRETEEKIARNFGMPNPEGYRKACRLMELAERFRLPLITFIDTAGAYPGIDAERRGQGEAIAKNLAIMSHLKVPIISTIIGEGGSGGALAIGVSNCLIALQYSTFSVISPEGCASILWKTPSKAAEAAEAMGVNAERLFKLGLVDQLVTEPLGGAHRNHEETANTLKQVLIEEMDNLRPLSSEILIQERYKNLQRFGIPEKKK